MSALSAAISTEPSTPSRSRRVFLRSVRVRRAPDHLHIKKLEGNGATGVRKPKARTGQAPTVSHRDGTRRAYTPLSQKHVFRIAGRLENVECGIVAP